MISLEPQILPLEELLSKIASSRQITTFDFNLLSLVLLCDGLNEEDKRAIQRVFHALRRGWFTLIGISDDQYLGSIKMWLQSNVLVRG